MAVKVAIVVCLDVFQRKPTDPTEQWDIKQLDASEFGHVPKAMGVTKFRCKRLCCFDFKSTPLLVKFYLKYIS